MLLGYFVVFRTSFDGCTDCQLIPAFRCPFTVWHQCTEAMRSEGFVLLPELLLFACHVVMVTMNECLKYFFKQ